MTTQSKSFGLAPGVCPDGFWVKMRYRAKFPGDQSTIAEIWRFLDYSKMAAVRHLGFVTRVFGTPTKGI